MKKNFNMTMVLTGVLVALVLWYTLYEKKYKITRKEAAEDVKRLVTLDRKDVQEFTIEKIAYTEKDKKTKEKKQQSSPAAKYETFEFKKTGEDWYLVSPLKDLADASMVASALSAVLTAKYERELDPGTGDLSAYGLDKPKFRLRIRKDSNSPWEELQLGNDTPVGFDMYAMGAKNKAVYSTSRSIKSSFDRPLKDFRNKKLVHVSSVEIPQLEVFPGDSTDFILKKEGAETWKLARENVPADKAEVQKTLSTLVGLRAKEYVSEKASNLAQYGLSRPAVRLVITEKDKKEPVEVVIGELKSKAYAKRGDKDTIYEVDSSAVQVLSRAADEYQDRNLADFNRFNVTQLKFLREKEGLELQKQGDAWVLPSETATKIDGSKVDALIAKIQDAKIVKFASEKEPTGLATPKLQIVLLDKDNKPLTTLKFGNSAGQRVYGSRDGLEKPFLISMDEFKSLNVTKADFIKAVEKKTESSGPKQEKKS